MCLYQDCVVLWMFSVSFTHEEIPWNYMLGACGAFHSHLAPGLVLTCTCSNSIFRSISTFCKNSQTHTNSRLIPWHLVKLSKSYHSAVLVQCLLCGTITTDQSTSALHACSQRIATDPTQSMFECVLSLTIKKELEPAGQKSIGRLNAMQSDCQSGLQGHGTTTAV